MMALKILRAGVSVIICESAHTSIDLVTSAIKFLAFRGFSWSAPSLPFEVAPLGELVQAKLSLKGENGAVVPAQWDGLFIHADFRARKQFNLEMRLEYRAPFEINYLQPDFRSIVPSEYLFSLTISEQTIDGQFMFREPMRGAWLHVEPDKPNDDLSIDIRQGTAHLCYRGKTPRESQTPMFHLPRRLQT